MLDWTNRYQRYFARILSKHSRLYTEMVTTGALIYGDQARHLDFFPEEEPVALQLGGSDPKDLATCAKLGESWGYNEINLNVGCPSDRVQNGSFGACLMKEPETVRDCIKSMLDAVSIPVTVKCRIGVDDLDSYEAFRNFISTVAQSGCTVFIVHARKAWLKGLSPKQNREIPELKYDFVYRIKSELPHLTFIINGGVTSLAQAEDHLQKVDGVMIGREAYQNPFLLAEVDQKLFACNQPAKTREQVVNELATFIETERAKGTPLKYISRHVLGLFQGVPGAKGWRRHISQHAYLPDADAEVIWQAFAYTQHTPRRVTP